jgi:hypothetical protein
MLEPAQKRKVKFIIELYVLDAFPALVDHSVMVVLVIFYSQSQRRELRCQLPLLGSKQVVESYAMHPLSSDYSYDVEFLFKVAPRIVD